LMRELFRLKMLIENAVYDWIPRLGAGAAAMRWLSRLLPATILPVWLPAPTGTGSVQRAPFTAVRDGQARIGRILPYA
jgi:hypothetical protein